MLHFHSPNTFVKAKAFLTFKGISFSAQEDSLSIEFPDTHTCELAEVVLSAVVPFGTN